MLWRLLILMMMALSSQAQAGLILTWADAGHTSTSIFQNNTFIHLRDQQLTARFDLTNDQCFFCQLGVTQCLSG